MSDKGLAQGLAYRHDFSGAISNYQREDALERARRSEQMAQTKMLFEGIPDAPQVMGQYDREMIGKKYQDLFTELAEFSKSNPNYATDPEQASARYALTKSIQNDPEILRAISSTEQYNQMMAYQQANPNSSKNRQFLDDMAKWEMYSKHGSTDGVNGQGFTFINPAKMIDTEKELTLYASRIQTDTYGSDQLGQYHKLSESAMNKEAYFLAEDQGPMGMGLDVQYNELIASGKIPKSMSKQQYIKDRLTEKMGRNRSGLNTGGSGDSGSESGSDKTYSGFNEITSSPTSVGNVEGIQRVLGYDPKNESMVFREGFVMLKNNFDGDISIFTGGDGQYVSERDQIFLDEMKNQQYKVKVTGRTIALDGQGLTGYEVEYEIPYSENNVPDRQVIRRLEKAGFLENSEWPMFTASDKKDIDDGPSNITPKSDNIYFSRRKNDKGEYEETLVIRGFVPKRYNSADQMLYDQTNTSVTGNQSPKDLQVNIGGKFKKGDKFYTFTGRKPDGSFEGVKNVEEEAYNNY